MQAQESHFDMVVVGGGIYGLMVALEASRSGASVLLVEREDWGCGTTFNWLRILHGGLRYLQTLDLPRFYESVRERSWFLQHFPEFVRPLRCVMPLYAAHSHSPMLMWAGITVNDGLSLHRNRNLPGANRLPRGRIITKDDVCASLPYIPTDDLRSGATWYDAVVNEPQRLLLELLRWCRSNGVTAQNYTEVTEVLSENGNVSGVEIRSSGDKSVRRCHAPLVINATGHAAPEFAARFGCDVADAPKVSWAWNILFDVPTRTASAGAITARRPDAQTFFAVPWRGRILVGTGHAAIPSGEEVAPVPDHQILDFIRQVNEAAPALRLSTSKILRVFEGRLPISTPDGAQLTKRPYLLDHSRDGLSGFHTVWGIKYTTARGVARKLVQEISGSWAARSRPYRRPPYDETDLLKDASITDDTGIENVDPKALEQIVNEALEGDAQSLQDLVFRRCGLGDRPDHAEIVARQIVELTPWSAERRASELAGLLQNVRCAQRKGP